MLLEFRLNEYLSATDARRDEIAMRVHDAFTRSIGLRVADYDPATASADLRFVGDVLADLPVSEGFNGLDKKSTTRRTFGLVHALGSPQPDPAYIESQLAVTDADPNALADGAALIARRPDLSTVIGRFNRTTDDILFAVMDAIRRTCAIPDAYYTGTVLPGSSCRLRAIYYGSDEPNSSCGVHPDGNMLSVLYTDTPGLRYFDEHLNVNEPGVGGPIVMPGSLLYRWTSGLYRPTFHFVRDMADVSKTSVVYFYNLAPMARYTTIPYRPDNPVYVNDIKRYKPEDISPAGPFAELFDRLLARVSYGARPTSSESM
jgi:hypothetical protein